MRHYDLWYKTSTIYNLDVKTFFDSDGDGIGDFQGLLRKLDYIAGLGVTCVWLQPFHPSPLRDNGYDVTDYYAVDPRLGSLGDFVEFSRKAHEYGIRILIDLVVNHTSIDHPWFQAARSNPSSKFRDYYVWSDEKPENADKEVVFPGHQESIWTYDKKAGAYYLHHFYEHQPDLNIANPHVREELFKIAGFWLELGVSGFRIDAAPFLIDFRGVTSPFEHPEQYLEEFRQFLSWRRGDAILLAEANVEMDQLPTYIGKGDRMHMLFNFYLNQNIFLALAHQEAAPLYETIAQFPKVDNTFQWANFLRNHDELSLDKLTEEQRQFVFEKFGPEKSMQLYDRGLRRRLAPMLGNDRRCMELAYSLMLSLPGTPVLRYGQEIGMGENLALEERNSVRTPMQWSSERNGGFSSARKDRLFLPMISEGEFNYEQVNVAAQNEDPASFLHWMQKILRIRRQCSSLGVGTGATIKTDQPAVFAHCCTSDEEQLIAVHNLSPEPLTVKLKTDIDPNLPWETMIGDSQYVSFDSESKTLELNPFGYRWLRSERV